MINNISWSSFVCTVVVIGIIYYLIVIIIYYPNELKQLFTLRSLANFSPRHNNDLPVLRGQPDPMVTERAFENFPPSRDVGSSATGGILPPNVQAVMDEVEAFFVQASETQWTKQSLIASLQGILAKYPAVKDSAYKNPLNTFINLQSELDCSIHLNEEDKILLWKV